MKSGCRSTLSILYGGKMAKVKITELVEEVLKDFLKDNSLELYHSEFLKEGRDWFLRVYIDKLDHEDESYVSTEDCELVSRYLSEELDKLDPISMNYYLEVSSPGMDRVLYTEEHYKRFTGQMVDVTLYKQIDGRKTFEGELKGLIENEVIIEENGTVIKFPLADIAKVCLAIIF